MYVNREDEKWKHLSVQFILTLPLTYHLFLHIYNISMAELLYWNKIGCTGVPNNVTTDMYILNS